MPTLPRQAAVRLARAGLGQRYRRRPERAYPFTVRRFLYPITPTILFVCAGKLLNAWTETPTTWYPLPLAIGALLLVAIQYRKKSKRASREVHVDEDGLEVIRLKGPWQACTFTSFYNLTISTHSSTRSMYLVPSHSATCHASGAT